MVKQHTQPNSTKALVTLTGMVIPLMLLTACSQPVAEQSPPAQVISQQIPPLVNQAADTIPGDIHARYEMPLSFRLSGQLHARLAEAGQTVKRGQVLAQLDASDLTRQLSSSKAALEAAEHRLQFATQQRDRDEAQYQQKLISQLQQQQTQDNYAAALAGRDQAKQQYELAKNQLGYASLTADHDGVITAVQAQVGQVLPAGQAVFQFAWSGEREVQVNLPENRINSVKAGQTAVVTLPALPGQRFTATVREVIPAADANSRTYLAKLTLANPGPAIQLGMTAEVAFESTRNATVRIPVTALFHKDNQPAVWVIRSADSKLELRTITIGSYQARHILVSQGLKAGESIVTQGVHTVYDGEKVTPIAPLHPEENA